ncbi:MAG TPA: hypothetical protein VM388_11350 [Acidimicrobiales bacterium]|nr:hypothetical protein [Acidimicrobiales bacterium]
MSTTQQRRADRPTVPSRRAGPTVAWAMLIGGVAFFIGGSMHPGEDPPGLTLEEHLHLLYTDPAWFPSHAVLLVGLSLMAVGLVTLARGRTLASVPQAQKAATIAAAAGVAGALAMVLHLVAGSEADRIAAGQSTPITDVQLVVETLTVPAFGFGIAALALIGSSSRLLGNRVSAAFAVVGGVGYGLAGGTAIFTDALNFLFPAAAGIAVWAVAVGVGLLARPRVPTAQAVEAA